MFPLELVRWTMRRLVFAESGSVSHRIFLATMLVATLVRFAGLLLSGTEHVGLWRVWSHAALRGLLGVYGARGVPPERRRLTFSTAYTTADHRRWPWARQRWKVPCIA